MKRKIFLALILIVLSAAGANAQVLIGADDEPHPSAVLELRSSSAGLLLPQVKLDNIDNTSSLLTTPVPGMLVCNLTGSLRHGVYYWNGEWKLYIGF
ncbi:MAG: hypothetical protein LBO74_09965 [Candidatus Symbiothrix sp.]|jgi:hypothetical protein|nr:hypothetical protein [Candidatus Symbiothrix sp.]